MRLPERDQIYWAYARSKREGLRSDLITTQSKNLFLKTESKLPGGSYKIRGVREYFEQAGSHQKSIKVLSAGNLALAAAIESQKRGIVCQALVPIGISEIKKHGLKRLGAEVVELPFTELWDLVDQSPDRLGPDFLHPLNFHLLSGYATMALEIHEQSPTVNALVVPYGLGGLALSLAHGSAIAGIQAKLYVAEIEGHAPLKSSLGMGRPTASPKLQSFIEAMGAPAVLAPVFENIQNYSPEVILVTENETRAAIRELYQEHGLRAEGAAGATYAAAKKVAPHHSKSIVAILSGGNISDGVFQGIVG